MGEKAGCGRNYGERCELHGTWRCADIQGEAVLTGGVGAPTLTSPRPVESSAPTPRDRTFRVTLDSALSLSVSIPLLLCPLYNEYN